MIRTTAPTARLLAWISQRPTITVKGTYGEICECGLTNQDEFIEWYMTQYMLIAMIEREKEANYTVTVEANKSDVQCKFTVCTRCGPMDITLIMPRNNLAFGEITTPKGVDNEAK